jgi:hypothetical protein
VTNENRRRGRRITRQVPVGAVGATIVTIFGLVATFISVQNEAPKLWNLGVAFLVIVALVVAGWLWRTASQHRRADRRRTRTVAGLIAVPALVLGILGILLNPTDNPNPDSDPRSGVIGPPADLHEHEVWEEGANAHFHRIPPTQWAMTDFVVTLPYVRSIEVNATGGREGSAGVDPTHRPGQLAAGRLRRTISGGRPREDDLQGSG